ncbi:chain-length determining protein [Paenarthrobacter sp. NPDC057355]|uniref:chain-length determining protein n=1 Tax=Paenarthrobacter sp. NPDC057355 TaxID=3346105 RepID=UPI0036326AC3
MPVLLLTLGASLYIYEFGPRTYETTVNFAVISPDVPRESDVLKNPDLGNLNGNNPYLRATDPSLVTDVAITRLNSTVTAQKLSDLGAGDDYSVRRGSGGNGFIIEITGKGSSPEAATTTTTALASVLKSDLYELQKVNGADDRYLFTALPITPPSQPTEQYSSRLRAVIVVLAAGGVLVFAAASAGSALRSRRARRRPHGSSEEEGEGRRRKRPSTQDNKLTEPRSGGSGKSPAPSERSDVPDESQLETQNAGYRNGFPAGRSN